MMELIYVITVYKKNEDTEVYTYVNENDFQCACRYFSSKGYRIETSFEWQ